MHSLLISGNTKQLRQAAKLMTTGKQNTAENLRLLANIIKQEYETAPTNRIDALSWGDVERWGGQRVIANICHFCKAYTKAKSHIKN